MTGRKKNPPRAATATSEDGRRTGWRDKLTPTRWLFLVLAALSIVLIAQNNGDIRIRLLVPVVTMPLYAALLIMFVLGGLCGLLLARSRSSSRRT